MVTFDSKGRDSDTYFFLDYELSSPNTYPGKEHYPDMSRAGDGQVSWKISAPQAQCRSLQS